jgi:hypothetical protein
VHARELAALLPGWVIWTANGLDVPAPEEKCGIIVTERAAAEYGIGAGVLIRATGTRWPLPEINWPAVRRVESAVLIDFADEFHPKAVQNAAARTQSYQRTCTTLLREGDRDGTPVKIWGGTA